MDNVFEAVLEQAEDIQAYPNATSTVLPHQLAAIIPRDLSGILQRHRERLDYIYSAL